MERFGHWLKRVDDAIFYRLHGQSTTSDERDRRSRTSAAVLALAVFVSLVVLAVVDALKS